MTQNWDQFLTVTGLSCLKTSAIWFGFVVHVSWEEVLARGNYQVARCSDRCV